ncbi:hypothetical protein BDV93DRAFT_524001 [Ceratobasidium sp. AG-I]|nr:hypothetical protein BDV93DRAFT_524001 [Ceratobasidium sp. AG-I]
MSCTSALVERLTLRPESNLTLPYQSIHAQSELPKIQKVRGISYAGAWTKYGFHGDVFTSGLKAACSIPRPQLRVSLPFPIASPDKQLGNCAKAERRGVFSR